MTLQSRSDKSRAAPAVPAFCVEKSSVGDATLRLQLAPAFDGIQGTRERHRTHAVLRGRYGSLRPFCADVVLQVQDIGADHAAVAAELAMTQLAVIE